MKPLYSEAKILRRKQGRRRKNVRSDRTIKQTNTILGHNKRSSGQNRLVKITGTFAQLNFPRGLYTKFKLSHAIQAKHSATLVYPTFMMLNYCFVSGAANSVM